MGWRLTINFVWVWDKNLEEMGKESAVSLTNGRNVIAGSYTAARDTSGHSIYTKGKEEQGKKDILVPFLPTVKHGRATVLGKDAQLCNPAALPAYMELS